jgi:hypothetical protein
MSTPDRAAQGPDVPPAAGQSFELPADFSLARLRDAFLPDEQDPARFTWLVELQLDIRRKRERLAKLQSEPRTSRARELARLRQATADLEVQLSKGSTKKLMHEVLDIYDRVMPPGDGAMARNKLTAAIRAFQDNPKPSAK